MIAWLNHKNLRFKILSTEIGIILGLSFLWLLLEMHFIGATRRATSARESVQQIAIDMLQATRAEKDFMLNGIRSASFYETGESEDVQKNKAATAALFEEINRLYGLVSDERKDQVHELLALAQTYQDTFSKLVAAEHDDGFENWGLEGQLRKAAQDMETRLQRIHNARLMSALVELRRDERDYLLYGDENPSYRDKVKIRLENLKTIMSEESIHEEALTDDVQQYDTAFQAYALSQEKIGLTPEAGFQGEFRRAVHGLENNTDSLIADIDHYSRRIQQNLLIANFLVFFIGLATAGVLAHKISRLIAGPIEQLMETAGLAARSGDLTQESPVTTGDEVGQLATSFNKMLGTFRGLMLQVQDASLQLTSAATELRAASAEQSSGATEQASTVTQLSATMEELSQTASSMAVNAQQINQSAEITLKEMQSINDKVSAIAKRMLILGEKSQSIGSITSLIDGLADQTNLLALNAAIEAARAGEAGRGFAVVAAEIRKLAERSTGSTKEIRSLITEIQTETNTVVLGMEGAMKAVTKGLDQVGQTTTIIKGISMATQQQKTSAQQVAQAIRDVNTVTKEFASSTKQTAISSEQLARLAEELKGSIGAFKLVKN